MSTLCSVSPHEAGGRLAQLQRLHLHAAPQPHSYIQKLNVSAVGGGASQMEDARLHGLWDQDLKPHQLPDKAPRWPPKRLSPAVTEGLGRPDQTLVHLPRSLSPILG